MFWTTSTAILGNIVTLTISLLALLPYSEPAPLFTWWVISISLATYIIIKGKGLHGNTSNIAPHKLSRMLSLSSFSFTLPWTYLIIRYIGHVPAETEILIITTIAGISAAGAIRLSRYPMASLTFLGSMIVPSIAVFLWIGDYQHILLTVLFASFSIYLVATVYFNANLWKQKSQAMDKLHRLAMQDTLTSLPNRRHFREYLDQALIDTDNHSTGLSLFICDVDHFKNVNDTSGHETGDLLLKEIANRLKDCIGDKGMVARIGGDEFAIIANNQNTPKNTLDLAKSIIAQVSRPLKIDSQPMTPSMSIGISMYPFDAHDEKTLLTHADMALQRGKSISRGQFDFFDQKLKSQISSDELIECDLRVALTEKQFELFYQPKIDIRSGHLSGFETLLRWRKSNGKIATPGEFFSVAEKRGMMPYVSDFAGKQAIQDMEIWENMGLDPVSVAINIHSSQIRDPHRMDKLVTRVNKAGINPKKLILEITEDCVIGRGTEDVPKMMQQLQNHGFSISLDDFGTGFASLTHLKTLPVNEIKIDRSFIRDLLTSPPDRAIVHAMIKLASSLGLQTVAEGIEESEQHSVLLAMGCNIGQGYYYAKPMDVEAATNYLKSCSIRQQASQSNVTPMVSAQLRASSGEKVSSN